MAIRDWELAEFTNASGAMARPIPPGRLLVPGVVRLERDQVHWTVYAKGAGFPKGKEPSANLLDSFVKLWSKTPAQIVRFASTWGSPFARPLTFQGSESIERWKALSRYMCALLDVAARLSQNQRLPAEWEHRQAFTSEQLAALKTPVQTRRLLQREISGLLQSTQIGFALESATDRGFRLQIRYGLSGSLFAALALQLALTVAAADKLFMCSGCGFPYARPRGTKRPKPGQANFCSECGQTEALRQADRRRKQKMAEVRRLHAEGVSPREIATQLATKPATVRGWLKKAR